jgi:nitrogen-specific signal transduction histidine kinase
MASGIAHKINNPLAIIGGNAWRLKKDSLGVASPKRGLIGLAALG